MHIHTVLLEKLHTVCREFLNDCMQNVSLAGFAPLAPYLQADQSYYLELSKSHKSLIVIYV